MPNTKRFDLVNDAIIADIKKELRLQGHHLTGALERSLTEHITQSDKDLHLTASALEYIESLEKGIPGNQITIDSGTLAGMTRYVELRMGYKGGKAAKVALAILRKQQQEGNPTRGSYAYSATGERTEAVSDVFFNNHDHYSTMIDEAAVGGLDDQFHTIKSGTV